MLILGLLIAAAVRLPPAVSAGIAGVFALCHGFAHGAEMPPNSSALVFGLGFAISTALLHLAGIGLGLTAKNLAGARLVRFAGAVIVATGAVLCFQ